MRKFLSFLALASCLACGPACAAVTEEIMAGLDSPTGFAFDSDGALWISEWGAGTVSRLSEGKKEVRLSGLPAPAGLAFDDRGRLFIAGYGDGNIYVWNGAGRPEVFASGLSAPTGLLLDHGSLLVANRNAGEIVRIFPDGRKETHSRGHKYPVGIARTANGSMFVSCYGGSIELVRENGSVVKLETGLATPGVGIVPADADSAFVVDYGNGKIAKVDTTGKTQIIANHLPSPVALGKTPDGALVVGCWGNGKAYTIKNGGDENVR